MKHTLFSMDGPIIRCMIYMGNLILVSFFWIVCCLPVVTVGWSTTAMYYSVVKAVRFDRGDCVREFFAAMKREWKQGLLYSLLFTGATALLILDLVIWKNGTNKIALISTGICILLLFLLFATASYLFPLISRFELTFTDGIRLAAFLSMKHLPYTAVLFILEAFCGYAMYCIPWMCLVLPGITTLVNSLMLEKIFRKLTPTPTDGNAKWFDDEEKNPEEEKGEL